MISNRASKISSFIAMDVHERATVIKALEADIFHLELGDPDFPTPECIKEAGIRAIRDGHTHYTHSQGIIELREAICEDYLARYRVRITPGIDFGKNAEGYLRFSYANSQALIEEAMERLKRYYSERPVSDSDAAIVIS